MTIDERLANTDFPLPAIRQVNMAKSPTAISLGLGELKHFEVDAQITDAIMASLNADGFTYTANAGLPALRKAIATNQKLADGFDYTENHVVIGIGVQNAFYATLNALKKMGAKRVLIPEIHFGIYKKIPQEFGLEVCTYKLTANFGIDIPNLELQLLPNDVVIINSPANPTGRVLSANEQTELGKLFTKKLPHGYVLSDEIYSKLTYDGVFPGTFSAFFTRTVVFDGISKSGAAAGLRVGWAITRNEHLAKAITSVNAGIISCPPTANQHAALPIVTGKTVETIQKYNGILQQNCRLAAQILAAHNIPFVKPTGSFYFFAKVSAFTGPDTKLFCIETASAENGVVVIPGEAFGAPGYIRISLAAENLETALTRLVAHLTAYSKKNSFK